jgi:hypothetical protein
MLKLFWNILTLIKEPERFPEPWALSDYMPAIRYLTADEVVEIQATETDLWVAINLPRLKGEKYVRDCVSVHIGKDGIEIGSMNSMYISVAEFKEDVKRFMLDFSSDRRMTVAAIVEMLCTGTSCGWCGLQVFKWDTSYDGWPRCPRCMGN